MKNIEIIFGAILTVGLVVAGLCIIIAISNSSEIDENRYNHLLQKIDTLDKNELANAVSDGKISHDEYYYLLRDRSKTAKQLLIETVK